MDKATILAMAKKDKRVRNCEGLLREILNMSEGKGYCHVTAKHFEEEYDLSRRTFFRKMSKLIEAGYIKKPLKSWRVEVIYSATSDTLSATIDSSSATSDTLSANNGTHNHKDQNKPKDLLVAVPQKPTKLKREPKVRGEYMALSICRFGRVKLTEAEFNKLLAEYGREKLTAILKELDIVLEENPKKYSNHYLTALKWLLRNENRPQFGGYTKQARKELSYDIPEDAYI
jgi:hypothetical protein